MSDVMSVRLHLSGVGVREVRVDSVDRLEVEVESMRTWPRCPFVGSRVIGCGNCEERHLEGHGWFEGGLTRRLARRLVADAKVMSNWGRWLAITGWDGIGSWRW